MEAITCFEVKYAHKVFFMGIMAFEKKKKKNDYLTRSNYRKIQSYTYRGEEETSYVHLIQRLMKKKFLPILKIFHGSLFY